MACAVGTEGTGKYRAERGEHEPAVISEHVRIVPPPTGGSLRVSVETDRERYHVYDPIKVSFGVNRDSYVYIFSTDASGITRQIFPNYYDTNNFARAGKAYYIPDRGYDLEVLGPQGREHLDIVAVMEKFPFLSDYHRYTLSDPYPASREGAVALIREIESSRREPSSMTKQPIRPALKENLWASSDASFYVMGNESNEPGVYKVARRGNLDVDTFPSNARIYIDADYYGRSPQVINRLDIGLHKVLLEKEGYIPYEVHVYIKGNETKQMDVFMKETPIVGGAPCATCPPPPPVCAPPVAAPVQQRRPVPPAQRQQQGVYRDFGSLEK